MGVMEKATVVCPSGLKGEIRPLRVSEILAMQDPKLLRNGTVFNHVVANCWLNTIDVGPYSFDPTKPPPWPQLLHADKISAIRAIRAITGGQDYEFDMRCSNPGCDHRYVWVVNLHDIKTRPIPEDTLQRVKLRQSFFVELPDAKVEFRQLINADDATMIKYVNDGHQATTAGMLCRILGVRVDGDRILTEIADIAEWLADLDVVAYDDLENAFDATDGGLDLRSEAECPRCSNRENVIIPLLQSISRFSIRRSNEMAKQKQAKPTTPTTTTPTMHTTDSGAK